MLALAERPVAALLFEEASGSEVEAPTVAQAEALGALLGRFHATKVEVAQRRWRIDANALAWAPLRSLDAWLQRAGGEALRDAAPRCSEVAALAAEMVSIASLDRLPLGLCHGDIHLENLRFEGTRPTLLDLECCGIGPCAYDLACYWRKRIGLSSPDTEPPPAEWDALLRGYEQTRVLTATERRAIPALAALRAIWVMAMPAAPDVTWGQDWIDGDYLDAHVAMIERSARAARKTAASSSQA